MKLDNSYLLFKKRHLFFWLSYPVLYLLSGIYCLTVEILKFAYKMNFLPAYRPKCKIISVGNITLGGTGKTPLVEWIADYLSRQKKKVGIIIRGYKRPEAKKCVIAKRSSGYFEIGDEARMLKESLGEIDICVGRDKIESARQLEREKCDIVILDDGFQHWRLARDLDIVAIDCSFSILNQKLLPLGRLREPLSSLKRADVLVFNKTDFSEDNSIKLKEELNKINPSALIINSVYEPICFYDLKADISLPIDSDKFLDKPVFILAGIVNPLYFDRILSKLKLKIKRELIYPDHYEYTNKDIDFIKKLAQDTNVDTIITTHKDAVRLRHFLNLFENINLFYLKIKLKITKNEEELSKRLLAVFSS